jgi:hypothetical protein
MIEATAKNKVEQLFNYQHGRLVRVRELVAQHHGASRGKKHSSVVEILDRAKQISEYMKAIFWPAPNRATGDMQA